MEISNSGLGIIWGLALFLSFRPLEYLFRSRFEGGGIFLPQNRVRPIMSIVALAVWILIATYLTFFYGR